jgi:hypothetical protein
MKQIIYIFLFYLFFVAGSLSAQTSVFAGLGVEGNSNTREGAALGGSLSGGLDLDQQLSLGLKVAFSSNMDTVTALETTVLFRYYLPLEISGFFAQLEMGTAIFFENNKSYPAFLVGAVFGWRYYFYKNWYIEPYVRGGYPFVWGAGVLAGLSFDI